MNPEPYSPRRDPLLWLAFAAGPLVWLGLYLYARPQADWLWPLHRPQDALLLGLVYPLLEELIFRGWLQGELLRRSFGQRPVLGLSVANLLTSLLFSLLHLVNHPPAAAAAVLLPSLVFGHFRERDGRLRIPIALHAYYNLGYFWLFSPAA
ncbi:JDVT-CTERM system glutamic-type intramembrane protease [Thiohalobacter sp. IOR34]|uniref:JDVT-CTERM system glutamic-type intramembrane protease MrtJ n=1 Tax=Thiohalobacter sp. IOR34 TaxID=3057176 RepID=UPI0025B1FE27|nr:JDVT-CTERM system glutamic-type intramembrane protease [Thiohalobacter sp. IOR34]WJW74425.1 JDVT-CTERM system glutamic-type intramembrane protease [Thiohalobacter sp. IOR34]